MVVYQYQVTKNNVDAILSRIYKALNGKYCNVSTRSREGRSISSLGTKHINCFSRYFESETQVIEFSTLDVLFNVGDIIQFQDDWVLIQNCDQTLTGIQILEELWIN